MRRLLFLICAIVIADTLFYSAIVPLLPSYADDLHLSGGEAGVLTGAYAAGTLLGSLPGGWLAGRVGVKPTLILGLVLMTVSTVTFGWANDIVVLDAARFVQGLGGSCCWAAGLAWLMLAAPAHRRGELIGTALGAAIFGLLIGPVVGTLAHALGTEIVFSTGLVLGVALLVAAWRIEAPAERPASEPGGVAAAARNPRVIIAFWLVTLPALCYGAIEVLVPLRLDELGAAAAAIGAVFLVAALMEGIVSPLAGRLSDRRGRMLPLRLGLLLATPITFALGWPESIVALSAILLVASGAYGLFWAPAMALLSDAAEDSGLGQGPAMALTNLAWALGQVVGAAGGGGLADLWSDEAVYAVAGVACAVTLLAVFARRPAAQPVG